MPITKRTSRSRKALHLYVKDVAGLAHAYAHMGVRVLSLEARKAVLELPCGVELVLQSARALARPLPFGECRVRTWNGCKHLPAPTAA
jgi:hypothetical protein